MIIENVLGVSLTPIKDKTIYFLAIIASQITTNLKHFKTRNNCLIKIALKEFAGKH